MSLASHQLTPLNLLTALLQKNWLWGECFREDEDLHKMNFVSLFVVLSVLAA